MANATQGLDKRVARLEILTHRYWLYRIMAEGLRKYLLDGHMAWSYLELQLNLSIGHLSPTIIAPRDKKNSQGDYYFYLTLIINQSESRL